MTVLAFRGHGAQRRQRIETSVQQRLQRWCAQWAAEPGACDAQLQPVDATASDGQWWSCAETDLHLAVTMGSLATLGAALAAVPSGQGHAIAEAIGRRALADLLLELGASQARSATMPALPQLAARHGVIRVELDLPGISAVLYLPLRLCDAMVPPSVASATAPLASRRAALLSSAAHLTATLDLGAAGIDVASSLRVGETLITGRIEDTRVRVHAADGAIVFTASLHSSGGRKALRCLSVENQQGKS